MVCLPLLDVKLNFAVPVGKMGLFKSEYFLVRVRYARRSYPRTYARGDRNRVFLRKSFIVTRRLGKKPGFFGQKCVSPVSTRESPNRASPQFFRGEFTRSRCPENRLFL